MVSRDMIKMIRVRSMLLPGKSEGRPLIVSPTKTPSKIT